MEVQTFQPNNHSKWQITYRAVAPPVFALIKEVFMKYYSKKGDAVISIEQVDEAEINSNNFKVTYERGGKTDILLVRRYPNNRDRAMLEDIAGVLTELSHKTIRVPEIIFTRDGKIIEKEGDYSYAAYKFISGDHFRGTLSEIVDAASEIGKMDALLKQLPNSKEIKQKVAFPEKALLLRAYSPEIWQQIFKRAEDDLRTSSDPDFDRRLLSMEDLILNTVEQAPLSFTETFEKQLVHFDLHPHNLLTDGEKLLAIIDFDSLREFERIRATAFALHRFARQYVVFTQPKDKAEAIHEVTQKFLDAYQKHNKLTSEEIKAIPYFIRTEALARLTYAMKDNYLNGNGLWKGDLDKQTASIAEAKYFE